MEITDRIINTGVTLVKGVIENFWRSNTWGRFPRTGGMVKMWHFFNFIILHFDQTVCFFQLFLTVLERLCPLDLKMFLLVLAHLEPELDLFEADDFN